MIIKNSKIYKKNDHVSFTEKHRIYAFKCEKERVK